MEPHRIYIGGLTPDILDTDVVGRFKPFGSVAACELIRGKAHSGDPAACRGFAYVTFTPKDEAALARVFSLYNGCKWRGQKLRVELAKPHYTLKLQQEWQEQQLQQEQQAEAAKQPDQLTPAADSQTDHVPEPTIRITVPGTRKSVAVDLTAKSKTYRNWFPLHREKRIAELDWEPPPPAKRAALQAAADVVRYKPPAAVAAAAILGVSSHGQHQQQQFRDSGATTRGVTVPYQYKEHQHQQQPPVKGLKKQLDQEHFSHLKLLKKIAEQEQSQQQQYSKLPAAPADKSVSKQTADEQQRAALAGVVVFSDDEDVDEAAAILPAAADDVAQQLDRFADDSDSESEQPVMKAPTTAVGRSHKQQSQQQRQQQQQQPLLGQDAADVNLDPSSHDDSFPDSDLSSDFGPDADSLQDLAKPDTLTATAADTDHVMQAGQQQQPKHPVDGHLAKQGAMRAADTAEKISPSSCAGLRKEKLDSTDCDVEMHTDAVEFELESGSGNSSSGDTDADEDVNSILPDNADAAAEWNGGSVETYDCTPRPTTGKAKQQQQQQQQQQRRGMSSQSPQQLPTVYTQQAAQLDHKQQQQQQLTVIDLDESAEQPLAAAADLDDRFGSDSEEVLRDVDSDDEGGGLGRPGKQQKHSRGFTVAANGMKPPSSCREELLCPVVPRASTGRAATIAAVQGTAKQRQQQQQLGLPVADRAIGRTERQQRPGTQQRKRGLR